MYFDIITLYHMFLGTVL